MVSDNIRDQPRGGRLCDGEWSEKEDPRETDNSSSREERTTIFSDGTKDGNVCSSHGVLRDPMSDEEYHCLSNLNDDPELGLSAQRKGV